MQGSLQAEEAPERGNIRKRMLQKEVPGGGGTRKMLQEKALMGCGFLKRL